MDTAVALEGDKMAIYSISDLHLSFAQPKPMDIFGFAWREHAEKLRSNWDRLVLPTDIVLIPGDLSWALRLSEAMPDIAFLHERPGRKILIRGNHDYWWSRQSTSRLQRIVDMGITFLQGTSVVVDGVGITGTRGWRIDWETGMRCGSDVGRSDDPPDPGEHDKIYHRELAYFEKGLRSIPDTVKTRIAMLHIPPFDEQLQPNEFARLLTKYRVDYLVYGHIHIGLGKWLEGDVGGVTYRIVSADVVDFTPQIIIP
jgi:uncharacterized protein